MAAARFLCARSRGRAHARRALVEHVDGGGVRLQLVNSYPLRAKSLVIQGRAFGEHTFTRVADPGG